MLSEIITLGRRIYNLDNMREQHRFIVFIIRALLHYKSIMCLYKWFQKDETRKAILAKNPFSIEKATRGFFYSGSTFKARCVLIRNHINLLCKKLNPSWAIKLGQFDGNYCVWRYINNDINWTAVLTFEPGQRKEGMITLKMVLDGADLYQMMFWLGIDKNNEEMICIGAMQGPNMENAKAVIKNITKLSYRYRTKNLILYMTMAVARSLRVKHIYAVSNEGYYANNHVRRDRKLKTNFGQFWQECGGHITEDTRFYELPLVEKRKTIEEVPTRKRAIYRKRFDFQDDVDKQIMANMEAIII